MRKIIIVDYDPRWPLIFEEEKRQILSVIGELVLAIEHVGSTAVPGLSAKPVIDTMVGIRELAEAPACYGPLSTVGYEYVPDYEDEIPDRRFFNRGPEEAHRHLHMAELNGSFWERHILFRDFLRAHPETAEDYCALKKRLAREFTTDMRAYTDGKTSFIESVVARAREEKEDSQ